MEVYCLVSVLASSWIVLASSQMPFITHMGNNNRHNGANEKSNIAREAVKSKIKETTENIRFVKNIHHTSVTKMSINDVKYNLL